MQKKFGKKVVIIMVMGITLISLFIMLIIPGSLFAKKGATLKVLSMTFNPPILPTLAEEFEKKTGVKVVVERVPWSKLRDKIVLSALSGKGGYDVVAMDNFFITELAKAGWLVDVKNMIPENYRKGMITSVVINGFAVDEGIYGLGSWWSGCKTMFYNARILKNAGIAEPAKTWSEFLDQAQKIKEAGLVSYPIIWTWDSDADLVIDYIIITWTMGGKFFDKNHRPIFDKGKPVKALQFMMDTLYKYRISDPASLTSSQGDTSRVFNQGRVAFIVNYPFAWTNSNNPQYSRIVGEARAMLIPGTKAVRSATINSIMGWSIMTNSENKDVAWDFILFLTSKKNMKRFTLLSGDPPIWRDLYTDPDILRKQPMMPIYGQQQEYGRNYPPETAANRQEWIEMMIEQLQKALTREVSPKQALQQAVELTEKIIK